MTGNLHCRQLTMTFFFPPPFVLVVDVIILGSFAVRLAWRSRGAALRALRLCSPLLSTGGRNKL